MYDRITVVDSGFRVAGPRRAAAARRPRVCDPGASTFAHSTSVWPGQRPWGRGPATAARVGARLLFLSCSSCTLHLPFTFTHLSRVRELATSRPSASAGRVPAARGAGGKRKRPNDMVNEDDLFLVRSARRQSHAVHARHGNFTRTFHSDTAAQPANTCHPAYTALTFAHSHGHRRYQIRDSRYATHHEQQLPHIQLYAQAHISPTRRHLIRASTDSASRRSFLIASQ